MLPDLSVVKSGPESVIAGRALTWILTVRNSGNAAAPSVTVTDTLPSGVVPGTVSAAGWTCSGTTTLSCTLDAPLAAGSSSRLTIGAIVPMTFTGATVSNTAVVGPEDPTPADNTSTFVTTVTQTTNSGGGVTLGGTATSAGSGEFTGGGGTVPLAGTKTLPRTGAPLDHWVPQGILLLLVGLGLVVLGRRTA